MKNRLELNDYQNGSKQVCISMGLNDFLWIKKAGYSPSRLMRKAISDLRADKTRDSLEEMYIKTEKQANLIADVMEFLEKEGQGELFFNFREQKEQDKLKIKERKKENVEKTNEEIKEVLGEPK